MSMFKIQDLFSNLYLRLFHSVACEKHSMLFNFKNLLSGIGQLSFHYELKSMKYYKLKNNHSFTITARDTFCTEKPLRWLLKR